MDNPRRIPIHLDCPHCHNPIELVAGDIQDEVVCPSCGSSFHLDPERTEPFASGKLPQVGKFELIEIVGRGAFGTVYRARDSQLKRTVAVKVPRSGQLTTHEDEDRFVREARNAAQLQHSGIVPVYEVGRSDEFTYIVSEFVEGNTLADALTARRFGFRESAGLVAKVAVALQHAHDHGVVHRDLKPSNIMLTPDGTPRVMDFGLAKRDAGEITMTIEGQVLGTPAYMSPEQASGQAHHVDGRSDVYSLGVILFELLAGELPFRGNQRMLLQQVMHDEPRSPRSLNDRIPRDLETICLKAMAKEPGRRYQSAQAMADDLNCYVAGQPIAARPVGRIERGWRWCKRNPVVAGLSVAVTLALVTGTAISMHFGIQADTQAREAIAERNRAETNLLEATRERERAKTNLAEANRQRERAETGFREARATVDKYYTLVSESTLLNVPGLQPLRKELLESALEYYKTFLGEGGDDPKVQAEMAEAYARVGDITSEIGSKEKGLAALVQATEIYHKLVGENPSVTGYQERLANAYHRLGNVQSTTGRMSEAEVSYRRTIELYEKLLHETPTAIDYQSRLAGAFNNLGNVQKNTGRMPDAEASYRRSIEIHEKLVRENPSITAYQMPLANAYNNLGLLQHGAGRKANAEASQKQSIEIYEKLVRENPTVGYYQNALALAYTNLGNFQEDQKPDAEASFRRAIDLAAKLVRESPAVSDYQNHLALAYLGLAHVQSSTGRYADAEASYQQTIEVYQQLARENPTVAVYQVRLALAAYTRGNMQGEMGRLTDAEASLIKAVDLYEGLMRENSRDTPYLNDLVSTHIALGSILAVSGKWRESAGLFGKAVNESDHKWPAMFCLALAQSAAGDEAGYRATSTELLVRHGENAKSAEACYIALACVVGEHAVEDPSSVLELAKRAVASAPRNALFQGVLGAAQYRAGHTEEAVTTLKGVIAQYSIAMLAAPAMADGLLLSELQCQVFLTRCYRDLKDHEAIDKQSKKVRWLIEKLESAPRKTPLGIEALWPPFVILMAKRELAKLAASQPAAE